MSSAPCHRVLCGYAKTKAKSRWKNIYLPEGAIHNNMLFNQRQKGKLESKNGLKGKMKKRNVRGKYSLLSWELMQMDSYQ